MKTLLLAAVMIATFAGTAVGEEYPLDSGHTEVSFSALHFGVSQLGGWFTDVSGSADYNADNIAGSSVNFTLKTQSLVATNVKRQEAVLSPFFLDAEKFPEISFASTKVEATDDGYMMTGNLTIKETTKEVSFPFSMLGPMGDPFGGMRMGIQATLTVNRRDFGVLFDRKMNSGVPLVGDDVTISLSAEFAKPPETEEED